MFAQTWVRHVRRIVFVEDNIPWFQVPGYREILRALLEEAQHRDIHDFPDTLVETLKSFLSNPKLLQAVVRMTFGKTKPLDSSAVLKTMDMNSQWFQKVYVSHMTIPADFCWTFFAEGVEMLLSLDHGTSTAKVIWLLYQILHTLPLAIRNNLLTIILKPDVFYGFFFNWS